MPFNDRRRKSLLIPALCLAILAFAATLFAQSQGDRSMRKSILENFERIGMNTTPGDATLLRILVEAKGAQKGLEIGSANGYGAMNMGLGFERTGGHLTTLDINPSMVRQCRDNIGKMQLEKTVECLEGDALRIIPELEGTFDFVFIDAVKSDYLDYFRLVEPLLSDHALIVADNVIAFEAEMKDFLSLMEEDPAYEMVIVRASDMKDDGMAIIYRLD